MKTTLPQFVLGYHGCDAEIGQEIIAKHKQLIFSRNVYDWLGTGIYFWENAPFRAMEWAKECAKNPRMTKGRIKKPFVVGAIIDLGNCLNLTDTNYMNVLREAYDGLTEAFAKNQKTMPKNVSNSRALDCAVINAAVQSNTKYGYPDFDSVRGAYIEGEPVYPNANIYRKTHIQICIRNPECIKGYFLPADFTR